MFIGYSLNISRVQFAKSLWKLYQLIYKVQHWIHIERRNMTCPWPARSFPPIWRDDLRHPWKKSHPKKTAGAFMLLSFSLALFCAFAKPCCQASHALENARHTILLKYYETVCYGNQNISQLISTHRNSNSKVQHGLRLMILCSSSASNWCHDWNIKSIGISCLLQG